MMGSEDLLAKAFADRPGDASRIVFSVRSSPLVNRHVSNYSDVDSGSENSDSDTDDSTDTKPANWIEYAQFLEQSDLKQQQEYQQSNQTIKNAYSINLDANSSAPIITSEDRILLSTIHPLKSNIELRICPYCSRPFWVSALKFHIESSCAMAPLKGDDLNNEHLEITQTNETAKIPISSAPTKPEESGKVTKSKKRKQDLVNSSPASSSPPAIQSTISSPAETANNGEPKKKVRKVSMTKKRRLALEVATAAALARGEKPPTLEDIKEDLLPRKKKREKYKSQPKAKLPVDVDKQCGVPLVNGTLCARSLTCKTHSMGAKRSVLGRSAPYDLLLANYQKRNQIKLASLSHSQQLADENEAFGSAAALNSDDEVVQVLEGVACAAPVPLEQKVLLPTRIKNQFFKMREMLADALLPVRTPRVSTALGGLLGRANAINSDKPRELHFIRPITVPRQQHLAVLKQQQHQKLHQLQQLQKQHQLQQQQQLQKSIRAGALPQAKILAAQQQHQALQLPPLKPLPLPSPSSPPPQQQQQQQQQQPQPQAKPRQKLLQS